MASGSKGREQQASALQTAATTATTKATAATDEAAKADPLEERRRKFVLDFDKWQSGESGPIDVRNMPGHDVAIGLYNDAKTSRDAGRVGRGLASLSSNANPNFAASLDKEMDLERGINASGMLENTVDDAITDNKAELTGLYTTANNRRLSAAGLYQGAANAANNNYYSYLSYLNSRKPSFLKQLALGGIGGAAGQLSAGFLSGGGSSAGLSGMGSGLSAGL